MIRLSCRTSPLILTILFSSNIDILLAYDWNSRFILIDNVFPLVLLTLVVEVVVVEVVVVEVVVVVVVVVVVEVVVVVVCYLCVFYLLYYQ